METPIVCVRRFGPCEAFQFDGTAGRAAQIVSWANEGRQDFLASHRSMTAALPNGATGVLVYTRSMSSAEMVWQPVFEGWWVIRIQDNWVDRALGLQPMLLVCSDSDFQSTFVTSPRMQEGS